MATKGYIGCVVQVLDDKHVLILSADDTAVVTIEAFDKNATRMLESASEHPHTYFEPMDPVRPETREEY